MAPLPRAVSDPARHARGDRWEALDLGLLLRDTADGVCAVDVDGRVTLWNRSAEHIVGFMAREVLGRLCCQVFVGGDRVGAPLCYNGCHAVTPGDRWASSRRFALTTRTKAGVPVRLAVDAVLVHDARGKRSAVVHLFRGFTPVGRDAGSGLTPRELQVLRLIADGANTRAIAARLACSPATVRNHVQSLLGKLSVHSRLEAVAYAARHLLLTEGPR